MILRDLKIIRQTFLGLGFRFLAVGSSFLIMPVMLEQLGATQLGVWLVLLSVFQWITVFDLGTGAGARNEMARAFASKDTCRIRQAIATGLFYTAITSSVLAIGCVAIGWLTPIIPILEKVFFKGYTTGYALWIVSLGSCASFTLNFIQMIYAAELRTAALSYFSAATNFLFYCFVYWWPLTVFDDLTQVSTLYLLSIALANITLVIWYYRNRSDYVPRRSDIRPELQNQILGFGIRIFIIQISAMVVFTTSRMMISAFIEPSAVVVYDAASKLFAVITMLHSLLMVTFWSSFTEAHSLGDWKWPRDRVKLLQLLTIPIILGCFALVFLSPWIIEQWMTKAQVGSTGLYLSFALLTSLSAWANVFAYFLNGIGDTRVQLLTSIAALAVHLPLCFVFTELFGLGLIGINLGTIVSITFFGLAGPIYVWRLLRRQTDSKDILINQHKYTSLT